MGRGEAGFLEAVKGGSKKQFPARGNRSLCQNPPLSSSPILFSSPRRKLRKRRCVRAAGGKKGECLLACSPSLEMAEEEEEDAEENTRGYTSSSKTLPSPFPSPPFRRPQKSSWNFFSADIKIPGETKDGRRISPFAPFKPLAQR